MKIKTLTGIPGFKLLTTGTDTEREFRSVYICDLLSIVLAKAEAGNAWLTVQSHKNIVGVASIKNIPAIIIAENFRPDEETVKKAAEENISILTSPMPVFDIAKILAGLPECTVQNVHER